jgi:hypothetical protein
LTVTGDVVDVAGKPASKVRLVVPTFPVEVEATADERGHFEFSAPVQQLRNRSLLAYSNDGEQIGSFEFPPSAEGVEALKPLRVELKPTVQVRIHVADHAGRPVGGAHCGLLADYKCYGRGLTDDIGRARFRMPANAQLQHVYAAKSKLGMDYRAFYDIEKARANKPQKKPSLDEPFELKLYGAQTVRIKVLEEPTETSVVGALVHLWLAKKPGEVSELNLGLLFHQLSVKTDETGSADFDWMPNWEEHKSVTFWANHADYRIMRGNYDLDNGLGTLTIKATKLVKLSGHVRLPDGSPAAGVLVHAGGSGYDMDSCHEETKTDAEGKYSFKAAPNKLYLVVARSPKGAASKDSIPLLAGQPREDLDLDLLSAIRVHGRITVGNDRRPVEGARILLSQFGKGLDQLEGVEIGAGEGERKSVTPQAFYQAVTNERGEYEFFVGPGQFGIRLPTRDGRQRFTVTNQKELKFDSHSAAPEKGELRGVVVDADSGEPVAKAEVVGVYRNQRRGNNFVIEANEEGGFQVERELTRADVLVRSADGALAGVVEVGPDDQQVRVQVRRVTSASGVLINKHTKQPIVGEEIQYGVMIGDNMTLWHNTVRTIKTDAKGKFTLEKLMQGVEYSMFTVDAIRRPYVEVGKFTAKDAEAIDLGTREFSPPPPEK